MEVEASVEASEASPESQPEVDLGQGLPDQVRATWPKNPQTRAGRIRRQVAVIVLTVALLA